MTKTVNAVALRAFSHAGDSFAKDQVIHDIDPGHLADWSAKGVDLVREATADEVKAAKGDETPAAKATTSKTTTRKAKAAAEPTPPAGEPPAADPQADA